MGTSTPAIQRRRGPRPCWFATARIAAVGTDRAIKKLAAQPVTVSSIVHGQTVIPGIVDSHVHLLYGAYALHGLNLTTPEGSITVNKPDELVARLKAYAAAHPQDPVILRARRFQRGTAFDADHGAARSRGSGSAGGGPQLLRTLAVGQYGGPAAGRHHGLSGCRSPGGARHHPRRQRTSDRNLD